MMQQSKRQAIININTKLAYKGGLFYFNCR